MKKKIIFWGFCLSGMAALIYEVDWTRELSLVIGSTTYALSTVLGAFLSGLALGAFICGKLAKNRDPFISFGYLQIAIGITGLIVHFIINNLSPIYAWTFYSFRDLPSVYFSTQFILVFLIILIPTSMMGATFPLAMKAYADKLDNLAEDSGLLFSINTLGSVLGALLAGFFLIPVLGLNKTELVASSINFIVGTSILIQGKRFARLSGTSILYIIFVILFFTLPSRPLFFNLYYANRVQSYEAYMKSLSYFGVVWEKEDIEGTVQVTKGGNPPIYGINIKGRPEGTSDFENDPSQMLMTYLPLASRPDAKSLLKIGIGPGATLYLASHAHTLSSIDAVEINASVLEAVKKFFYPSLFTDPRIHFIVSDARKYLLETEKKYDIITSQPSDPTDQSSGYLFTKEYYEIVKSRLSPKGVYSQFIPYYLIGKSGTDSLLKTFSTVFPYVNGWNITDRGSLLLMGSLAPNADPPDIITSRVENYKRGLSSTFYFGADTERIRKIASRSDIQINTDDKNIIEFIAARNLLCKKNC